MPGEIAAWVADEPVPAAEVTAELVRLRTGPSGPWLPAEGTAPGRQLRREVALRVVIRRLLEREYANRGLATPAAPGTGAAHPSPATRLDPDPALLGAALADVLAGCAPGRAVFAAVTAAEGVTEDEIRADYAANWAANWATDGPRDDEPHWMLRQAFDAAGPERLAAQLAGIPPSVLPASVLVPEVRAAVAAATAEPAGGVVVGPVRSRWGWHLVAVDGVRQPGPVPYPRAHPLIAATLLDRRRQRAFGRWVDARCAAVVRRAPGYEHPGDPRQPDATHRH